MTLMQSPLTVLWSTHCHTVTSTPLGVSKMRKHRKVFLKKSFKKEAPKTVRGAWATGLNGICSWTPRVVTWGISLERPGWLHSAPFKDSGFFCLRFSPIPVLYFPTCLCIYLTGQCSEGSTCIHLLRKLTIQSVLSFLLIGRQCLRGRIKMERVGK